jgi:hypothetical protein
MFSKPNTGGQGTFGTTSGTTNLSGPLHSSQIQTSTSHSPKAQAALGKIERGIGTLVSSDTLKAKGDAKVAEAEAVQAQRRELQNAESMDTNAQLARDRANV